MSDGIKIEGIDHVAIYTARVDQTIWFFEQIVGLKRGPRPDFKFSGAWLYAEGRPLVHLFDASNTEHRAQGAGALDHVAFVGRGFEAVRRRVAQQGIWSDVRENTADGIRRIFLRDPNGVMVELNFRLP